MARAARYRRLQIPLRLPLLETFIFGEIAKQPGVHPERIALYHLRDKDGYDVDLALQCGSRYAGIEKLA